MTPTSRRGRLVCASAIFRKCRRTPKPSSLLLWMWILSPRLPPEIPFLFCDLCLLLPLFKFMKLFWKIAIARLRSINLIWDILPEILSARRGKHFGFWSVIELGLHTHTKKIAICLSRNEWAKKRIKFALDHRKFFQNWPKKKEQSSRNYLSDHFA